MQIRLHVIYMSLGKKRFLKKIEVGTINLPNATSQHSRIRIAIEHDDAVLCRTKVLNDKNRALLVNKR